MISTDTIYIVKKGEFHGGYSITKPAFKSKDDAIKRMLHEVQKYNNDVAESEKRGYSFPILKSGEVKYEEVVAVFENDFDFISVFKLELK